MKTLKGYVRNRAKPEGCITECCIAEECVRFCSGYMQKTKNVGALPVRNEESRDEIIIVGWPIIKGRPLKMSEAMLKIVHRYVLLNIVEAESFRE